ncbi:uncharacterized protein LOC134282671 isoform X1 [Saccostrea cucullata]|uniref:uncharacterized protein LOC134282671 isoform X1 n=2 Tax=Saccostrea cuccullata TaxID=36930 RepID=UPI002ED33A37
MESHKRNVRNGRSFSADSQSKLLIQNPMKSFQETLQNCYEGVVEYMDVWKKFDGAGTHLVDSFCNSLCESDYHYLGLETSQAFSFIYTSSNGIDPSGKLREIEKLLIGLRSHLESLESVEKTKSHLQVLCQCVLLFLKVQSDYHQLCSVTISSLLDKLVQKYKTTDTKDVLQQMTDLDLVARDSPSHSFSSSKKKSPSASPKLPVKQNLKSSFFSLFERKNVESDGNSAFYVDLEKPSTETLQGQSQVLNKPEILVQIGLDPVQENTKPNIVPASIDDGILLPEITTQDLEEKNPLATEEELDSVVNLLSGIVAPSTQMQTIHENHLTVPSLYPSRNSSPGLGFSSRFSSRTPSPGGSDDSSRAGQVKGQRRSEGSIDFTGVARGNTWPHRSSLPSSHLASSPDGGHHSATIPRRYSKDPYLGGRHLMNMPSTGHPSAGFPWGYPEPKYRPWVTKSLPSSQGSDILHSSWSALQDSDDLSDDSSSGEPFFAMGLDLVNALEANPCGSSDEDADNQKVLGQHDKHSTNTWPPKQSWSQTIQGGTPNQKQPEKVPVHRPVSMQWSDPLANRTPWPGLGASQSMHGFSSTK